MATITVDPVTRIEGHLKAEVTTDVGGNVTDAKVSGTMARGIEALLVGKDPRDAPFVTARICGVCFGAHCWTSCLALEDAQYNALPGSQELPEVARLVRNLSIGACWLHDHPLHFYHLAALDYLDLTALATYEGTDPDIVKVRDLALLELGHPPVEGEYAGPLLPRNATDGFCISETGLVAHCVQSYLKHLEMQIVAKRMSALFSGKQPHQSGIVPGGVTELPARAKRDTFRNMLNQMIDHLNDVYLADIVALAVGDPPGTGPLYPVAISQHGVGHQNYLSYGGFPEADGSFLFPEGAIVNGALVADNRTDIEAALSEDITNSKYAAGTGGHPSGTEQVFDLGTGHSFVKAPRYNGNPMEVGPLARMMVAVNRPSHPAHSHWATQYLIDLVTTYGVQPGTVARHGARCLETMILCDAMVRWLDDLDAVFDRVKGPGKTIQIHDGVTWDMEANAEGWGMTEAPRGGLAHWVATDGDANIGHYACVVPTTWNASPTDGNDKKGPYEQALMSLGGTGALAPTPLNIVRVIRSFDPCIACAVHVIKPDGDVEKYMIDV